MKSIPQPAGQLTGIARARSLAFRFVTLLFLLVIGGGNSETKAQHPGSPSPDSLDPSTIVFVSNFKGNNVQMFSSTGDSLGVFCNVLSATGVAFDPAGNLYVASTDKGGNNIQRFAPDGSGSTFATVGLSAPHGLAFDNDRNLYVANTFSATITKFTPDGVGTTFADGADGISHPTDLKFDAAGNLWVTNAYGGPTGTGSVQKFTPDGVGTVFADSVFSTAYGIAFDSAGNVYVSNLVGNNVLKFSPDGTNLGVFCSTPLNAPHGMFFDNEGILYVANNAASTIEKFSPTGAYLGVFAHTGSGPHFFALATPTPTPTPTPSVTPTPSPSPTPTATPSPTITPTPTPTPTITPPTITSQPSNKTASLGQNVTFTVRATGTAPLLYQWQKNGVDIPGASQASYVTPPATEADNGSLFRVTVSNAGGSVTSNQATLSVNLPPTITVQPQDKTVNVGKTAKFSVTATGTKTLTYQWRKNGVNISGAVQPSYTTSPATSGDNGALFSVVVVNPYGSVTSTNAKLTVN